MWIHWIRICCKGWAFDAIIEDRGLWASGKRYVSKIYPAFLDGGLAD